jgi:hypothetical protein
VVTGSRLMVFPLTDCARGPYAGLQRWCSAVQCVASHRRAWEGERSLARLHAFLASPCLALPRLASPLQKRTRLRLVHFLRVEFIHTAVQLASVSMMHPSS